MAQKKAVSRMLSMITAVRKTSVSRFILSCLLCALACATMVCQNNNLKDALENPGGYAADARRLRIFVTAASFNGSQVGGISGADQKCNADSNKPVDQPAVYKALLGSMTGSANRSACASENCTLNGVAEHIDWVMKPNRAYYRYDGQTPVGRTDANGIWAAPISLNSSIGLATGEVWTGITMFAGVAWITSSAQDCQGWTSNAVVNNAPVGRQESTDNTSIGWGAQSCSQPRFLYCIEQ